MKLGSSRGIKSGQWYTNEMLLSDDINFLSQIQYQTMVDLLAILANQEAVAGTTKDLIVGGLLLVHDAALTCDLLSGAAISYTGSYWNTDVWGFSASAGDIFGVVSPEDESVAFAAGGAADRIDTLEIRPIRQTYNTKVRQFKDPVTGGITSASVNTRTEYGCEFQILEGVEGAGVAPTHTVGWIKVAEVTVPLGAGAINQANIKDIRDSDTWTTEAGETLVITHPHNLTTDIDHDALTNFESDEHRKTTISNGNPAGGNDGDVWLKYS